MPLQSGKTEGAFKSNVSELMKAYKSKGKIGNSKPANKKKALAQALAISYTEKRKS